jgi:hypothetical protein
MSISLCGVSRVAEEDLGKVIGKEGATDDAMRIILHAASAKQKNGALGKSSSAIQAVKSFCPLITGCLSDQRSIGLRIRDFRSQPNVVEGANKCG